MVLKQNMKLPELKSFRKIRDAKICLMYLEEHSTEEIAGRVKISSRQVNRILYKHRDVLKADIDYEKTKRIHWLKRQIKLRGDTKKDSADLMAQLHDEIEGNIKDKGQVIGETRIIIVRPELPESKQIVNNLESGREIILK